MTRLVTNHTAHVEEHTSRGIGESPTGYGGRKKCYNGNRSDLIAHKVRLCSPLDGRVRTDACIH
jgi:hypothetical protein